MPKARGEAQKRIQNAEAYRQARINEAGGQADRFISILEEYSKAKEITRKRLHLETMQEVFKDMPKVIIDDKASKGILPYLPLPSIQNSSQ